MALALIIALPFLGIFLPLLLERFGRSACAFGAGLAPARAVTNGFVGWKLLLGSPLRTSNPNWLARQVDYTWLKVLLTKRADVFAGQTEIIHYEWLPQLGLNLSLRLDGLGFLFALLILGIGLLVILYARYYLSKKDPMGRFFGFFLLFMGAMLGVVLSENLLLMLMFWELTSVSSFVQIGY